MYSTKISSEAQVSQKRSFHTFFQFRVTPLTPSQGDVTERRNANTTVLRAARSSSVNNLKTISEVGNNLTYQGSFVSPSNTYDQRLKKVPFELPKISKESLDTRSIQAKGSVATHSSDLYSYSWAKASHAPCVIYAWMHSHFKQAGTNKKRFPKRTLTCNGVSLFIL